MLYVQMKNFGFQPLAERFEEAWFMDNFAAAAGMGIKKFLMVVPPLYPFSQFSLPRGTPDFFDAEDISIALRE